MEPRTQQKIAQLPNVKIAPNVIAKMRQAKRVNAAPEPIEPSALVAKPPSANAPEPQPSTKVVTEIPQGIHARSNLEKRVSSPPPQLLKQFRKKGVKEEATPKPSFHNDDDWLMVDLGEAFYRDDDDAHDRLVKASMRDMPSAVPELDAIPSPLGVDNDSQKTSLLCGQDSSRFGSRKPSVPPSSYYDDWIWNALRPKENQVCVEMYVSARDSLGEEKTRKSTRRDGQEVTSRYKSRNQPAFSYDHHSLMAVNRTSSSPWGDAKRVMLVPFTYQEEEVKENHYATPYTQYKPKIAGAQPMLWGEDASLHVIHGRCAISFIEDDGQEHHSEYWVILPKDELERIHAQHFSTEQGWIEYAQDLSTDPTTYLRPNERFLGVWQGESAKQVYRAAKAQKGAIMPNGWQTDEVKRLNKLHYGKVKREKDRAKNENDQQAIISPLQAAANKATDLMVRSRKDDGYQASPQPLMASPSP